MTQNVATNVSIRVIDQAKAAVDAINKEFNKLDATIAQQKKTFANLTPTLRAAGVAMTAVGTAAAYSITKLAQSAGEAQGVEGAFNRFFGQSAPASLKSLQEATKNTVAELDIMKAANQAMLLGIDKEALPDMFKGAFAAAAATGRPVKLAIDDITLGMARQSKLILDNLGIMVNVEAANEKYARSIGKSSAALTDQERKIAFTNATMAALKSNAERIGEVNENASIRIQQAGASMANAFRNLGDTFAPAVAAIAQKVQALADAFNKLDPRTRSLIGQIILLGTAFTLIAGVSLVVVSSVTSVITTVTALAGTVGIAMRALQSFGAIMLAVGRMNVATAFTTATAAIGRFTAAIGVASKACLAFLANPVVLLLAGFVAVGAMAWKMQTDINAAWEQTAQSAAENTNHVMDTYDAWGEASKTLTGNEQKYALIRQKMAYHMAEAVRLSEAQIEQYRLGGSQAAIDGFQAQMDFHNAKVKEMGDAALNFQKTHRVNMDKVKGAYAAVGKSAGDSSDEQVSAGKAAGKSAKELAKDVDELRKSYYDMVVDVNRRLLDLKTQHAETMKGLSKDLGGVNADIKKLATDYRDSLADMVSAHNEAMDDLNGDRATSLVQQFEKVKGLQQEIADFKYSNDGLSTDQLINITENRQDKGNTLSKADQMAFNLTDSQADQVNTVLEYRRQQEALVKVLTENYDISESLAETLKNTYGPTQLDAIEKFIEANGKLKDAQNFEGMTDVEQSFSRMAKTQRESEQDLKDSQTDAKTRYDDELGQLRKRRDEIKENMKTAEDAYTKERDELLKTKIAIQEFGTTYIDNLNNIDKVTQERVDSLKTKMEDLRSTISSIDALLQRRADITGGGTITEAAKAARHAAGGVFSSPHLGWVAETGRPEAIIPLQGGSVPVTIRGGGSLGGGNVYHISIDLGGVMMKQEASPADIGRVIVSALENEGLKAKS